MLLLHVLSASLAITAEAPHAVAGSESPVEIRIEISEPAEDYSAQATASVGSISAPRPGGPGVLQASYLPPEEPFPQVAIIVVDVATRTGPARGWIALPVHGETRIEAETTPLAEVRMVAGDSEKVANADRQGNAVMMVPIPPGVEIASVHSVDRLGNQTSRDVPLHPPPFSQVLLLPAPGRDAHASWADAEPLLIDAFAVARDGRPSGEPPLVAVAAGGGMVEAPEEKGDGRWLFPYRAPDIVPEDNHAVLHASLGDEPAAALSITVLAGPPSSATVVLSPSRHRAGDAPIRAVVKLSDRHGNMVTDHSALAVTTEMGSVEPEEDGVYLVHLPDERAGRVETTITAVAGDARAKIPLPLDPGAPATATMELDRRFVPAGRRLSAQALVRDVFENPVPGADLSAEVTVGRVRRTREIGEGRYSIDIALAAGDPPGVADLILRAHDAEIGRSTYTVLPHRRAWGIRAGLALSSHSNLGRAHGGGLLLDFGVIPGELPFEVVARVGGSLYRPIVTTALTAGTTSARLHAMHGSLGPRVTYPLGAHLSLSLMATAGTGAAAADMEAPDGTLGSYGGFGPFFALTGGVDWRLGPGSLVADLGFCYLGLTGGLAGNGGGLTLAAGYRLRVL